MSALREPDRDDARVCQLAHELLSSNPEVEDIVRGIALTPEEIKVKWKAGGSAAANQGTWMHLQFELYLNRCDVPDDTPEMNLFLRYIGTLSGFKAYRTEWSIYGDDERLAGSIDFVAEDANGDLVLFDWKRTKGLQDKYDNSYKRMLPPLAHIRDCSGWHYRLQLNCYRRLIEKYYDRKVSGMFVVCTHPDI